MLETSGFWSAHAPSGPCATSLRGSLSLGQLWGLTSEGSVEGNTGMMCFLYRKDLVGFGGKMRHFIGFKHY